MHRIAEFFRQCVTGFIDPPQRRNGRRVRNPFAVATRAILGRRRHFRNKRELSRAHRAAREIEARA